MIEEGKLGGPQVRMVRTAAAMACAETLIIMPKANSSALQSLCNEVGIAWRALTLTRITREWRVAVGYIIFFPVEVLKLVCIFRRERVDLVHASGGSWQYKAVLAAKLAGIPSVWHLNDTQMPVWLRLLFRLFSSLPSGYIFASARSFDYYGSSLADRIHDIVPAPVDSGLFNPATSYPGDEDLLAELAQFPVIGTVANINRIKGFETLIRAAAVLRRMVPDLRVVVVGTIHSNQRAFYGQLMSLAEGLGVASSLVWVGGRTDVRPLVARMDVYVCCSDAESSPVAVWEAMAMARAIVSTDVGDVSRHVIDGKNGFIVPIRDYFALADRVKILLSDSALRARFGVKSRSRAIDSFAPSMIADQTLVLYRRVIAADGVN